VGFLVEKGENIFENFYLPLAKYNAPSNPYLLTCGEWKIYRGRGGLVVTLYTCVREVPSAKLG
jgi:hypothetical protein